MKTECQDSDSYTLANNINTKSNGDTFFWKKDASRYIGKIAWLVELLPPTLQQVNMLNNTKSNKSAGST